jgi:hypothetical protein
LDTYRQHSERKPRNCYYQAEDGAESLDSCNVVMSRGESEQSVRHCLPCQLRRLFLTILRSFISKIGMTHTIRVG